MLNKFIFGKEDKIQQNSYFWNTVAGLVNAAEAVVLLAVIMRILPIEEAGIMTLSFAVANLMLTIGKAGVRSYQVTDARSEFSFANYLNYRILTTLFMILCSGGYSAACILEGNYSDRKAIVVFLICMLYSVDAIEDVFHGLYQKKGRLDVGAKCFAIRWIGVMLVFIMGLMFSKSLLLSSLLSVIFSYGLCFFLTFITYPYFKETMEKHAWSRIWILCQSCFPLFLVSFFTLYIGNAPKYSIDRILNSGEQAIYGFISMPVFVIGLINNFFYQPKLVKLSIMWKNHEKPEFIYVVKKQTGIIMLITIACEIGGSLLGIPILSLLYNTKLELYKLELLILLLGGGLLALAGFYGIILTIIRCQKLMLWCYAFVVAMAYLFSDIFVRNFQLLGAAYLYLLLMVCLTGVLGIILGIKIREK